jgi:serine protease
MPTRLLLPALTALGAVWAFAPAASASQPDYSPGHVVVRFDADATRADRLAVQKATGTSFEHDLPGGARSLDIEDGTPVKEVLRDLRRKGVVRYAHPDYEVRAAATEEFIPNDPGKEGIAGGWRRLQWNFDGPAGVNAPMAWAYARAAGAPGGRGAVVAVIDSGVAYEHRGPYRRGPDLYPSRFVSPYDFVENDAHPNDEESHGTHVTGTIAQKTNNGEGVTGLAYGVKIMPLRVLNADGDGRASYIARAIRYAARNGADVINMSVEFDLLQRASDIPEVLSAIRYARKKKAVMVAASGNDFVNRITYPAKDEHVIAVGATTDNLCRADYSNTGKELDIMAPGGGDDAAIDSTDWDREHCDPASRGRNIWQETFTSSYSTFGLLDDAGTSFAAPHVSAVAALIIASGRLGPDPSPIQVEKHLEATAKDLGAPGPDTVYGAGLLDAEAALRPFGAPAPETASADTSTGTGGTTTP